MFVALIAAAALFAAALYRTRTGKGAFWFTLSAILLALAGGFLWIGHAKVGVASSGVAPGGLPLQADYRLVPVLTPDGQSMYLNAQMTPLLFFGSGEGTGLQRVERIYGHVKGIKKPLSLVRTEFHTTSPKVGLKHTNNLLAKAGLSMAPWFAQLGPPGLYVAKTPTLVWYSGKGVLEQVTGFFRLGRALRRAVALP